MGRTRLRHFPVKQGKYREFSRNWAIWRSEVPLTALIIGVESPIFPTCKNRHFESPNREIFCRNREFTSRARIDEWRFACARRISEHPARDLPRHPCRHRRRRHPQHSEVDTAPMVSSTPERNPAGPGSEEFAGELESLEYLVSLVTRYPGGTHFNTGKEVLHIHHIRPVLDDLSEVLPTFPYRLLHPAPVP